MSTVETSRQNGGGGGLNNKKEMFRAMLIDAVAVLCRNTMPYDAELTIEGLIGITADKKDIVLVNINEILKAASSKKQQQSSSSSTPDAQSSSKSKSRKRKKMQQSSMTYDDQENSSRKLNKVEEESSVTNQHSKDYDYVKTEQAEAVPQIPYGGYRNELYNTNDDQPTPELQKFPPPNSLQHFPENAIPSIPSDFAQLPISTSSVTPGTATYTDLGQSYSDLLLERMDENGLMVYQCSICQKIIKSKGNFGRHIKGHINATTIHTCDICNKTFGRKDNLRRHMHMVHQVETPTKGSDNSALPEVDTGESTEDLIPGFVHTFSSSQEKDDKGKEEDTTSTLEQSQAHSLYQYENNQNSNYQPQTLTELSDNKGERSKQESQSNAQTESSSANSMCPPEGSHAQKYFQHQNELTSPS